MMVIRQPFRSLTQASPNLRHSVWEKKKMRFKTITLLLSLSLLLVAMPLAAVNAQKKGAASTGNAKLKTQISKSQSAPAATA